MYWWKGRQPALFSDKNVTVSDGKLHLTMRKEKVPEKFEKLGYKDYTSAALHTKVRSSYGYYEVKAKPMNSAGSSSFWFQVEETPGWLTEIDVFEIGGKAKGFEHKYNMNLHVFRTPKKKKHWSVGGVWVAPWRLADDYHVYGLEWTPDRDQVFRGRRGRADGREHALAPTALPDLRQRDDAEVVRDAQGRGFAIHLQRRVRAGVEEAGRYRLDQPLQRQEPRRLGRQVPSPRQRQAGLLEGRGRHDHRRNAARQQAQLHLAADREGVRRLRASDEGPDLRFVHRQQRHPGSQPLR